mmetsp:Transcript_168408/g.541072  ORF Transcript_168408/g.541072 Transcript_168408/m.541072 type:complete len:290 (-) Transcript_168408:4497-5366(-)
MVGSDPIDRKQGTQRLAFVSVFFVAEVLELREGLLRCLPKILFVQFATEDPRGQLLGLVRPFFPAVLCILALGFVHALHQETSCLEGAMLHGNVHRQAFVCILVVDVGVGLQHQLTQAGVALLSGHVQWRAEFVLAPVPKGLPIFFVQHLQQLEDRAMTRTCSDVEERLAILWLEMLEPALDDLNIAMWSRFREHFEHLSPPWICQQFLKSRKILVGTIGHSLGCKKILEALHKELELDGSRILGESQEHRMAGYDTGVETAPNLLHLLGNEFLDLSSWDLQPAFQLHL